MNKKTLAAVLLSISLVACGPDSPAIPAGAAIPTVENPAVAQVVPQADKFDTGDAAVGALAGAAAGYMMGKGATPQQTVVVAPGPSYGGYSGYRGGYGRTTTTVTTTRRSVFGNKTVTTRTTRRR